MEIDFWFEIQTQFKYNYKYDYKHNLNIISKMVDHSIE